MNNKKPTMLLIMDGFGLNEETYGNAIAQAKKPALDEIFSKYPMTRLDACGEPVGLPDGQMGNSEVGHLNIGAGRIVNQALQRITLDAKNHTMENNQPLIHAMDHVQETGGTLHFFGLPSLPPIKRSPSVIATDRGRFLNNFMYLWVRRSG